MADAEIVAVGSELLTPGKIDTNSLFLTDHLNALGIAVVRKSIVGDERELLASTVRNALSRARIILLTGGLGPTEDDVTRDAVAIALDRPLVFRQDLLDEIENKFRKFGRKMTENNRRQAYLVEGAEVLENPRGTAVGQWIDFMDRMILLLPGPPRELNPMFTELCVPRIAARLPAQVLRTRFYRVTGMGESELDAVIAPVYTRYQNPATTILAGGGDLQIHLRARCASAEEAEGLLAEVGDPILRLLGNRVYSTDGDSLETVIGKRLREAKATLAVAESCTGGLVAARITSIPGSSDYFLGGFLTYNNAMKTAQLGVPEKLIAEHTTVSEPVARAMAEGARERTGATWAVSVTGEAGPESSSGAAVGTLWIGIAGPSGVEAQQLKFPGDRERVRTWGAQAVLNLLRLRMS